jgi:hypothetical protein
MLRADSPYAETRTRHKYFYLSNIVLVQFRHSERETHREFPQLSRGGLVSQSREMEESVLASVDDMALAQAMVRVWGLEASLKANDNACIQTFMGNDAAAQKWHRVLDLIAALMTPNSSAPPNAKNSTGSVLAPRVAPPQPG